MDNKMDYYKSEQEILVYNNKIIRKNKSQLSSWEKLFNVLYKAFQIFTDSIPAYPNMSESMLQDVHLHIEIHGSVTRNSFHLIKKSHIIDLNEKHYLSILH